MGTKEFGARWNGWAYGLLAETPGRAEALPDSEPHSDPTCEGAPYEWRTVPRESDQLALFCGNRQHGNWFMDRRAYYSRRDDGEWDERPSSPAIAPPGDTAWPGVPRDGVLNFGVEIRRGEKLHEATINTNRVSIEELLAAIGPEMVPAQPVVPSGPSILPALDTVYFGVPLWLILAAVTAALVMIWRKDE